MNGNSSMPGEVTAPPPPPLSSNATATVTLDPSDREEEIKSAGNEESPVIKDKGEFLL